ncbi:hypothetical protein AVEN_177861-1 [Araneus ventricosus]|uniref:Uncharacterized protein n=1 Tax=Araneus ventricosus TaxID=182803 RepID=A0A4Y2KPR2_ARAVE|nr:hypothetical protein AVEN_177861-1 [Araneus ventricosus]
MFASMDARCIAMRIFCMWLSKSFEITSCVFISLGSCLNASFMCNSERTEGTLGSCLNGREMNFRSDVARVSKGSHIITYANKTLNTVQKEAKFYSFLTSKS